MLLISASILILYLIFRFFRWVHWLFSIHSEPEPEDPAPMITDIRKKHHEGYIYASPTRNEDKENRTYEWDVIVYERAGEGNKNKSNYEENTE